METDHKKQTHEYELKNWRAWGSWFSWGSPVGMGLGWALFIIPLGVFIWLLHLAGLID